MNISSVIRGLLGDSKPGNAKPLELKEGQVVRGSVVSVSDDGADAVLQIQGVQVRAKLETPLRPGETTLLQVQPPGENGVTVMKPLTGTLAELPQASLNNLLQEIGLPDTKGNRELLLAMQRSGLPLTKDNVAMVQNMMTAKPAQVPVEEWVQATGIAFQRGLPVTGETVKGLHQAVFGPPLHQMLKGLAEQLESMLAQTAGKTLPTGEQAATVKPAVMGGLPVPLSGEQTGETIAASGGGRAAGGTSGLAGQFLPGSPSGAAPVADGSQDAAGNAVKGNGQTGTGTAKAETIGIKLEVSNGANAGKGAGIPAGTGIPGESPRAADAGVAGSRPGTTGAAVEAAGRVIAGQPEGERPGEPMAAVKCLLLRCLPLPQQGRRRQQLHRQRSWRQSCWRCWTRCAARPQPHRQGPVRRHRPPLHRRAARRLRLPEACRSLCQPAQMRCRLAVVPQHLRELRLRTRLSPTRGTRGWGAC